MDLLNESFDEAVSNLHVLSKQIFNFLLTICSFLMLFLVMNFFRTKKSQDTSWKKYRKSRKLENLGPSSPITSRMERKEIKLGYSLPVIKKKAQPDDQQKATEEQHLGKHLNDRKEPEEEQRASEAFDVVVEQGLNQDSFNLINPNRDMNAQLTNQQAYVSQNHNNQSNQQSTADQPQLGFQLAQKQSLLQHGNSSQLQHDQLQSDISQQYSQQQSIQSQQHSQQQSIQSQQHSQQQSIQSQQQQINQSQLQQNNQTQQQQSNQTLQQQSNQQQSNQSQLSNPTNNTTQPQFNDPANFSGTQPQLNVHSDAFEGRENVVGENPPTVRFNMAADSLVRKSALFNHRFSDFKLNYRRETIQNRRVQEIVKECDTSNFFKLLELKGRFVNLLLTERGMWEDYCFMFLVEVEKLFTEGDFAGNKFTLPLKRELVNNLSIFVLAADAELRAAPFVDYVLCYILSTVPLITPQLEEGDYTKKEIREYWNKVFKIEKKAEFFKCLCYFYFNLLLMNRDTIVSQMNMLLRRESNMRAGDQEEETGNTFLTIEQRTSIISSLRPFKNNTAIFWDFLSKFFKLPVCFFSIFLIIELIKSSQFVDDRARHQIKRAFEILRLRTLPKYDDFVQKFSPPSGRDLQESLKKGMKEVQESIEKVLRDVLEKFPFSVK